MLSTPLVRHTRAFPSTLLFDGTSQLGIQRPYAENSLESPIAQLYKATLEPKSIAQAEQFKVQSKHNNVKQHTSVQQQFIQQHKIGSQLNVGGKEQQTDRFRLQAQADYQLKALKKQQELPRPGLIFVALSDLAKKLWQMNTRRTQKQASKELAALARSEVKEADKASLNQLG